MKVHVIYSGGYIPTLGIVIDPDYTDYVGWLVYKNPDEQWVTLADLKPLVVLLQQTEGPMKRG